MLCTLFHSLLSSLRKSLPASSFAEISVVVMIQNTHPTHFSYLGLHAVGKKKVRGSLGFLVTVLPLACQGTTEKLLGLFGLSFSSL